MRLFFCLSIPLILLGTFRSVTAEEKPLEPGMTAMFNGEDLSGWSGREDLWSVEDGAITGRTSDDDSLKQNTFLIWDEQKPGDFEMRCQFKIEAGNSGIQYRSKVVDGGKFVLAGYQADIGYERGFTGNNYEERGRGILARGGEVILLKADGDRRTQFFVVEDTGQGFKPGEWNHYRIVARGNRLQHYINGTMHCEVIDEVHEKRAGRGVVGLELHAGPPTKIQFKDLRIKILK